MKNKTRTLTLTAVLVAITLIFGFTPVGYLMITPWGVEITLMCLPVIIGTLVLGWRVGLPLGGLFAITSIVTAFRNPLGVMFMEHNVLGLLVMLILPRLALPLVVWLVSRLVRTKKEALDIGIASLAGSLTNTGLYVLFMYLFFSTLVGKEFFSLVVLVNGLIEAAVAALVCPPIVKALKKSVPPLEGPKPKEKTA